MSTRALGSVGVLVLSGTVGACSLEKQPSDRARAPGPEAPACVAIAVTELAPPAVGELLPDLSFEGTRADGSYGSVRLHDYSAPCAPRAELLVLRVHGGEWCGTCLWHAAHGRELLDGPAGDRISLLDVVVRGPDGNRIRKEDVLAFRAHVDAASRIPTIADPDYVLRSVAPSSGAPLPLFVFVDRRTMKIEGYASNPTPDALEHQAASLLAAADHSKVPEEKEPELVDGRFARNEWDLVVAMGTREPLPGDPTNAVADDILAARLGAALFSDTGFSPSGKVSCQTCHNPRKAFSDGLPRPFGGTRHTPRIRLAAYAKWQFWDGRADAPWVQALGPFENPDEIASSRVRVARRVVERYSDAYKSVFPKFPLPAVDLLPEDGRPGDRTYDSLPKEAREAVTRTFVNVGKAIAAFERTFSYPTMRLDRYAKKDFSALSSAEKAGLSVFLAAGCAQCHFGPRLTNDAFHVTRMENGVPGDRGRYEGLRRFASAEIGSASRFSDAPRTPSISLVPAAETLGAFKTPSLRAVAGDGAFGHGGTVTTLVEVTEHYGRGALPPGDPRATGTLEPWLPVFDESAQWSIAPFLESLREE